MKRCIGQWFKLTSEGEKSHQTSLENILGIDGKPQ